MTMTSAPAGRPARRRHVEWGILGVAIVLCGLIALAVWGWMSPNTTTISGTVGYMNVSRTVVCVQSSQAGSLDIAGAEAGRVCGSYIDGGNNVAPQQLRPGQPITVAVQEVKIAGNVFPLMAGVPAPRR